MPYAHQPLRPRSRRSLVSDGALFALRGAGIYSRLTLDDRVQVCRIDSISMARLGESTFRPTGRRPGWVNQLCLRSF